MNQMCLLNGKNTNCFKKNDSVKSILCESINNYFKSRKKVLLHSNTKTNYNEKVR